MTWPPLYYLEGDDNRTVFTVISLIGFYLSSGYITATLLDNSLVQNVVEVTESAVEYP